MGRAPYYLLRSVTELPRSRSRESIDNTKRSTCAQWSRVRDRPQILKNKGNNRQKYSATEKWPSLKAAHGCRQVLGTLPSRTVATNIWVPEGWEPLVIDTAAATPGDHAATGACVPPQQCRFHLAVVEHCEIS
ncbi:hypothetical protein TNCV_5011151 [Trichonephila clavipes]|nr:hypothetical protein TNCV_5011151 [Trichonephila clavipes]